MLSLISIRCQFHMRSTLLAVLLISPVEGLCDRISYTEGPRVNLVDEQEPPRFTLGLLGGILDYPSVSNLTQQNGAGGVAIGIHLGAQFFTQFDFLYSFQQSRINRITMVDVEDIDHYLFSLNLKYDWAPLVLPSGTWFHLYTGVLGTHSRRQFNFNENSSYGFDGGASIELGFDLTRSLQIGIEYRYLTNLSFERNFSNTEADLKVQNLGSGGSVKKIESFDHQFVLVSGKIRF